MKPEYNYPIPRAAEEACRAHWSRSPQNAGLIFDRFVPDSRKESAPRDLPPYKKHGLGMVRDAAKKADGALLAAWGKRWEAGARAAGAQPFTMRTDWRFVPGLGRGGSLEVGFAFDRYGFPVLPGSSVKGIARSYAWLVEGRRGDDPEFEAIFGREADPSKEDPGASGGAVFFAAIPREVPKLDLDVMTPHVPNYYGGQQPPTNWQSPNPVYFLTVAPQTPFRFAVGWRTALDSESARLRGLAETWLREGLRTLGAGAKTSSGYGFFA